ncbi:MAG: 23S rRNA (uracil(1939)-C(5))-methyltransferase RlmD [Bacteroidetes bacterium]|nr:23S rRNA (uracil(1939)-C(5))-methyltransferase RlmD [Bacteroidota bacterium]
MEKIKYGDIVSPLEVIDINNEGKAVAKLNGLVYFINGAVPGDTVSVKVIKKKKNFVESTLNEIILPSPNRIEPVCKHFGTCGGCKWQNMSYKTQLELKQKYVEEALLRIGKLDVKQFLPIAGNSSEYYYRNKMEFAFSNKRWLTKEEINTSVENINRNALGFHIPGMFDKVLDINECFLQESPSNEIRNAIKSFAIENNISFFDIRNKTGTLRNLMIRSTSSGEIMLLLQIFDMNTEQVTSLTNFIKQKFPFVHSIQIAHNTKGNDTLQDVNIETVFGNDTISEYMNDLKFNISAKSFFQTNSKQALTLYEIAKNFADLKGSETVYDLYTGTGTIANFVARQCKKVVGIEYVSDAIIDAKKNAVLNNISNTSFFSGDMKNILTDEFINIHGKPDVIITDPPRAGMAEEVIKVILNAAPKKIVYVSCNPSTQARDLALLKDNYSIEKSQAVDMFPQTAHVENVVLLKIK